MGFFASKTREETNMSPLGKRGKTSGRKYFVSGRSERRERGVISKTTAKSGDWRDEGAKGRNGCSAFVCGEKREKS